MEMVDFEKKYLDMINNLLNEESIKKSASDSVSDLLQNDWKLPKIEDEFPVAQTKTVVIPITRCGKTWSPFTWTNWKVEDIIGVDTEDTAIKKSFIEKINGIL